MVCRILNPISATDNSPLSLSGTTYYLRGRQPLSHRTIVDTYQVKGFYGRLTPWLREPVLTGMSLAYGASV